MLVKLYFFYFQLILIVLSTIKVDAQDISFRHLTIDDGLSQNAIPSIIQDRQGFIWFGTKDGLNRYDGYTFKIFQNDIRDSTSIASNYISTIFEDHYGIIWIGTLTGDLNYYQTASETFKRVKVADNKNKITSITEDSSGNLWVGIEGNGLFCITHNKDLSQFASRHYFFSPDSSGISSNSISAVFIDFNGRLWIGSSSGLDLFYPQSNSFKQYKIDTRSRNAPPFPADNSVTSITQTKHNHLWLGTPSGLVDFNIDNGDYRLFPHHYNVFRFGWGTIIDIKADPSGNLWLATPGGLMEFITDKKSYRYYTNNPLDPNTISYNAVSSLCCDKAGILWIGTPGAGINIYDPKANRFATFTRKRDDRSRITGFSVRAICEDNMGDVWISTEVLYRWNRQTGELKSYETSSTRPDDFGNTGAWSIINDSKGILWFATSQGLFSYNPETARSRLYKNNTATKSGPPQKEVYNVLEDNDGNMWIVTEHYVSKLIDSETGKFQNYKYNKDSFQNAALHPCIYQDKEGMFWIGTERGLIKFNQKTGSFQKYLNNLSDPHSMNNDLIKSICPDPGYPEKYLWIGTSGGLNRFNRIENTFKAYTTKDGLPNNVVYGILPDSKGNLWLSTNHGLSRFNPSSITFKNFDVHDGLQSNEFNTGGFYKSNSGEMFFGGIKGLNYFYPEKVKNNPFVPEIVITDCEIQNRSSENGSHEQIIIPAAGTAEITLSYIIDIIRFEFSALDFSVPEKNKYTYKLENFNDVWINAGTHHSATFTQLPPGEYIFRVKGSNNDGVWNEKGASLKLIILPPWWQTWWAYLVYGILFLLGLYILRRYELNRLQLKNQLKLEKVESDSLRNLDQIKTRFFANISHEFRTPLTLILGQIESVLTSGIGTKEKGKLHIAIRNARRLLTLINQLLDISKIEAGSMELKAGQHNIVSFFKSLFYSFESLAESKKITLKFESVYENIPVVFEPDKIEKVFYNIVSNAFKFTPPYGEIRVNVNYLNSLEAEIRIKDSGIGIPADRLPKIFNRFYQVDNSSTREHEGTGIGLALTKELIELHKGSISVSSVEGEGTEFIIHLPLGDTKHQKEKSGITPPGKSTSPEITYDTFESVSTNNLKGMTKQSEAVKNQEIILIIEDNKDVRNYIKELTEGEYIVSEASNGEEGILRAREIIPDLIITDIMMPKMDGYKLSQEIRNDKRTSHIPIIMLTAKAGLDDKIEGLETGIDAYLTKPFSAKELKVRIKNLILQRKELRKKFSQATIIKPSEVTSVSIDQEFLEKIIKIIESHFEDEQFSVDKLSEEIGMSVSQLSRKLKALIDQPAGQLIRSLRLQRAADLLKQNAGSVAEICYKIGFNDQAYFSRSFKKQFGCSPSDYKKIKN